MRNFLIIAIFLTATVSIFTGCNGRNNPLVNDKGAVINGVRWATRNVDKFGTFAESPEDAGMLYQWNRRKAWNAADTEVKGWDSSIPGGETWRRRNDPCPRGWRVPTPAEFQSLIDTGGGVWTTKNGVSGRLFGTIPNQIFLPAVGFRNHSDGVLNLANVSGGYWSNRQRNSGCEQRNSEEAIGFWSNSDGTGIGWDFRAAGRSIRCVAE